MTDKLICYTLVAKRYVGLNVCGLNETSRPTGDHSYY